MLDTVGPSLKFSILLMSWLVFVGYIWIFLLFPQNNCKTEVEAWWENIISDVKYLNKTYHVNILSVLC